MRLAGRPLLALLFAAALVSPLRAQEPPKAPPPAPAPTPAPAPVAAEPVFVLMKTSQGEIVLELDKAKAPISVDNFVKYVNKGQYDGTVFHRVIDGFMIQGGGFDRNLVEKATEAPIKNEWQNGLKNQRGTIAMARMSAPDSATAQFYINVVDNDALDMPRGGAAYAVFGKVVSGMDAVDRIKAVPTGTKQATTPQGKTPFQNVPLETVTIEKVSVISKDEAAKRQG